LTTSAELSEVIGCFVIISQFWGIRWNLGHLPGVANAALDFFGRPDHELQEKYLLRSFPQVVCPYIHLLVYQLSLSGSRIGFWGLWMW